MLGLGKELFDLLNAKQFVGNQIPVVYGAKGLSSTEIASIEEQLDFRLPEDFVYLFQNLQDPGNVFFPWTNFKKEEYDARIACVLQGIEFDIEMAGLWLPRWGVKPEEKLSALKIMREDFLTWPKLLPICAHRFLAAEPCRPGNPVFSIRQTDIVYYGANLAQYLMNEFMNRGGRNFSPPEDVKRIDVWSDFVESFGKYFHSS